jgi:hypothetical protein
VGDRWGWVVGILVGWGGRLLLGVRAVVGIFGVGDRDSVRDFCLLRVGCCEPKFLG